MQSACWSREDGSDRDMPQRIPRQARYENISFGEIPKTRCTQHVAKSKLSSSSLPTEKLAISTVYPKRTIHRLRKLQQWLSASSRALGWKLEVNDQDSDIWSNMAYGRLSS